MWAALARMLALAPITDMIVRFAQRRPYLDIAGPDGSPYMRRWWVFNAYDPFTHRRRYPWIPLSIRVHHILRPDADRHLHDHPWTFRTFVLMGGYVEQREDGRQVAHPAGSTHRLTAGEFHRVSAVNPVWGAVTLFCLGPKRSDWGFLVGSTKIEHRRYFAARQRAGDK